MKERKDDKIELRVSKRFKDQLRILANKADREFSDFIRKTLNDKVKESSND